MDYKSSALPTEVLKTEICKKNTLAGMHVKFQSKILLIPLEPLRFYSLILSNVMMKSNHKKFDKKIISGIITRAVLLLEKAKKNPNQDLV